jgi:hypothetical protein
VHVQAGRTGEFPAVLVRAAITLIVARELSRLDEYVRP